MEGLDDRVLDTRSISPTCTTCKHLHMDRYSDHVCDAFPRGIPEVIWNGKNDHRSAYPDDNGIRFEPILSNRK